MGITAVTVIPNTGLELFVEAGTLPGGQGGSVPAWADSSGNGRDLTGTGASPTIQVNAVGDRKAVFFSGSNNPLSWNGVITFRSAFLVVRLAAFTNYNGLLTGIKSIPILEGRQTGNFFYDNVYRDYEYRLNDRIYANEAMPAPTSEWGIIYIKFWRGVTLDGIQIGQDRDFTDRKLNGSIALMALYSKDFCEADVRAQTAAIATNYQLPINNVFPFSASKIDTSEYGKEVLSDGGADPVLRIKRGARKTGEASFSGRRPSEFRRARAFWNDYHPAKTFLFRNGNLIPPEDTVVAFTENSRFEDKGATGILQNYGFSYVERGILSPGAVPNTANAGDVLTTTPPTVPANVTAAPLAATTPAIRGSWSAAQAFGGRTVAQYAVKINGGVPLYVGNVLSYDIGSLSPNTTYTLQVAAFDGSFLSAYSAPVTATSGAGAGGPAPASPNLLADDDNNTLSAAHPLGISEILVSVAGGAYAAYAGTINVDDVDRPVGYYKFKTRAAAGRDESPVKDSPAFFRYIPGNAKPYVINVSVSGVLTVGQRLTANYDFRDVDGDAEAVSTYKWYRADNTSGLNNVVIAGATGRQYDLQAADAGKYVRFAVTPVADYGTLVGNETFSPFQTTVANFKPAAPALLPNDTDNTLSASGPLGIGEIEYAINFSNSWNKYTGTINVGNLDRPAGFYQFRVRAAPGRDAGDIASSPAFTATVAAPNPPVASGVIIIGDPVAGQTLHGSYTYYDAENDAQRGTTVQWYRADDVYGTNEIAISGAAVADYVLKAADVGKRLRFGVIPRNQTAPTTGRQEFSDYTTVITAAGGSPVLSGYAITNASTLRSLSTASTSNDDLPEFLNFVATLVTDLQNGTALSGYGGSYTYLDAVDLNSAQLPDAMNFARSVAEDFIAAQPFGAYVISSSAPALKNLNPTTDGLEEGLRVIMTVADELGAARS